MRKTVVAVVLAAVAAALALTGAAEIRVEHPARTMKPGPLEKVDSFTMERKDGLLLRNGKPFFWVGNGTEFGAIQSGPVAMWLAWLHGYSALSLYPGCGVTAKKEANGDYALGTSMMWGNVSWFREAVRLGFLADFFSNLRYHAGGATEKVCADSPELSDIFYDHGHYLALDTGYPLGLDWQIARREATAQYFNDLPGTFYLELCREPGPNPHNLRAKRGFARWAERKYGTLAEANRVWRMDYRSWDEVIPLHLDGERLRFKGWAAARMRLITTKRDHPEMHYDWISYLQDDMAACVKAEFAALRKRWPGMPVTIDQRAHAIYNDCYASYDPEMFAADEDIFSLHYGWHPYFYRDRPYERKSLVDASAFPLFSMNYFRNLSDRPLINSEDIISVVRSARGSEEAMAKNDLAQLHATPWKFALDEKGVGLRQNWQARDFDDAAWGNMAVPGCWDETKAYAGKSCFAWYRKKFRVPSAYKGDYEDGSRKFLVYGKGVAQKGTVWLNGHKVGETKGWDRSYSFDVGSMIDWRGENTIVWCVDGRGGTQNGLRFYCHLLAHDMIAESEPFGEKQYRQMLFEQMMRGLSGVMLWSWHSEYLRPYMPELFAKLQTAARVALPPVRNYRSRVACLFAYKANFGLPSISPYGGGVESVDGHVDLVDALEFSGIRPDVLGEGAFRRRVSEYPLLVVNRAPVVEQETYEKFRDYVRNGGVALVSKGSLGKTFRRYERTDVETFDRGRGKVVFFDPELTMEPLMDFLKPYLPKPDVEIAGSSKDERPLVERLLVRNGDCAALYFCNWGGRDQTLRYRLPKVYDGWALNPVVGAFDGKGRVKVDSQDVAFAVLSKPGSAPFRRTGVSPLRRKIFDRVMALNRHVPVERADVLFPLYDEKRDQKAMGVESFPYLLDRVEAFGLAHGASEPLTWTAATLEGKKMVVLSEAWVCNLRRDGVLGEKVRDGFFKLIEGYVREGGSLFLIADSAKTRNINAMFLSTLAPKFGFCLGRGLETSFIETAFGDPCQGFLRPSLPDPLLEGVEKTLSYVHTPLMSGKRWKEKVGPFGAAECGRGRVFVSSDILAFQPFRIEHGDNAALLENVVGWLVRKPVTQAMRDDFKKWLFLTESHLRQIAAEEK